MSDGNGPPGAYFIGRPANSEPAKEKEAPQVAHDPSPVNASTPGDYFVGRPGGQPPPPPPPAEKGFLAKCFPCVAGGGAAN